MKLAQTHQPNVLEAVFACLRPDNVREVIVDIETPEGTMLAQITASLDRDGVYTVGAITAKGNDLPTLGFTTTGVRTAAACTKALSEVVTQMLTELAGLEVEL